MDSGALLLLVLGGLAIYEYSQLGVAAANVQILFDGVSINNLSNLAVTVLVQNVSNVNIVLNSMTLDITMNGVDLGNASLFPVTPIVIQSNTEQPVTIQFSPNWLTIPGAIMDIINSGDTSKMSFTATGTANINNLPLPINMTKNAA
jgi:SLAP domain-containing protein